MRRGRDAGYPAPPHRSQRAELPHWAPTSGGDAQTLFGVRMEDSYGWEPLGGQSVHLLASNTVPLTPSPQRLEPETVHLIFESSQFPVIAWHRVILEVSLYYAAKPLAH